MDKVDNLNSKFTQTYSIHTTPTIGTDAEATRKASASVVREFYKDYYDTLQKFVATQTLVTGSARESIVSNVKEEKKVIDEALQKAGEGNGAERVVKGGLAAVVVAVAAAVIVL